MVQVIRLDDYAAKTETFERTEEALFAWGKERRRLTRALSLPTASPIASMIDQQKVFEQQRRGGRARKRASLPRRTPTGEKARACASCDQLFLGAACPRCSPKDIAVAMGHAKPDEGPRASQSHALRAPLHGFTSSAAEMESVLDRLDKRMLKAVYRYYVYGQIDRIAARELGMPREEFTSLRRAAVITVAQILAQRRVAAVKFIRPAERLVMPAGHTR